MTWRWAIHAHQDTDSYAARYGGWRWWVRRSSQGFLLCYVVVAAVRTKRYVSDAEYVSPEGLAMSVTSQFPEWFLAMHRWGALLIVPLCVAQLQLVEKMDDRSKEGTASTRRRAHDAHVVVGYSLLGCVTLMSVGGVMLRGSSSFKHFPLFISAVVSPWIAMLSVIPFSVWTNRPLLHASAGSVMFKSCVAVPLARVLGVGLQHWLKDAEKGYYLGILASTVVTSIWTMFDLKKLRDAYNAKKERLSE